MTMSSDVEKDYPFIQIYWLVTIIGVDNLGVVWEVGIYEHDETKFGKTFGRVEIIAQEGTSSNLQISI